VANVKRQERTSLGGRWNNAKNYLRGIYNELKKVNWPSRGQLVAYTGVVLLAVALVALMIWLFDSLVSYLLDALFRAFT
jgi:preprotein translocase subunit SecE